MNCKNVLLMPGIAKTHQCDMWEKGKQRRKLITRTMTIWYAKNLACQIVKICTSGLSVNKKWKELFAF